MSFPLYSSTNEKKNIILFFPLMKLAQSVNKQAPHRLADPQLYFIAVRAPPSCQVSDFPFTGLYL